jgi:hypothetical protein
MLRVWVRSWKNRGWTPRLIFNGTAKQGRSLKLSPYVINFSYKRGPRRIVDHGKSGWREASLVRFPAGTPEDFVLSCGRPL